MAQQGTNKRAQGGGRTPNSEPKVQVFKDFNGVNFEQTTRSMQFTNAYDTYDDQTDLQMNYVFMQNNVNMSANKTLETRDNLVRLFDLPDEEDSGMSGPVILIGHKIYVAVSQDIYKGTLLETEGGRTVTFDEKVEIVSKTSLSHFFNCFAYYDNRFIALTDSYEIFVGDVDHTTGNVNSIENFKKVPNPTISLNGSISAKGDLTVSPGQSDSNPFRVTIAYTYVNELGPTKVSPACMFYASKPVTEWYSGAYVVINGSVPDDYDIKAVELYYATDDASDLIFLGRVDLQQGSTSWKFNWYGYIDSTSMWPIANLVMPEENYTTGPNASEMTVIDGRLYFWGNADTPERLLIGGNPGNLLSISPGTGGGFVDVEPGSGKEIKVVCKYKTQSGNSIVTMLCDSSNTRQEQRYNLVENTISLSNEQSMTSWQAEQVAGAVGCKSVHGALVCQDGLYSVNRYGIALTTMTMEYNSQIRTTFVSDQIKPIFVDHYGYAQRLLNSNLIELNNVLYFVMGAFSSQGNTDDLDNVIFCYDIDQKSWWTITLDVDEPIRRLFHVDYEKRREGIGIVTRRHIYMLPTTDPDSLGNPSDHSFMIETSQLSTQMPQQGWHYLSQLEFHFDYFVGNATIEMRMVDIFGRKVVVKKSVNESTAMHDYVVRMRVDQRVMSYVIKITGQARFRMTHFLARVYTLSNKVSQVWGFDDSISHRSAGSVHPTFKDYNDVRDAIFT